MKEHKLPTKREAISLLKRIKKYFESKGYVRPAWNIGEAIRDLNDYQ